jgi:hypothetical protein
VKLVLEVIDVTLSVKEALCFEPINLLILAYPIIVNFTVVKKINIPYS